MYNIPLNVKNTENFRMTGQIKLEKLSRSKSIYFLTQVIEPTNLINYAFAEVFNNLAPEFSRNIIDNIAKTTLVLPLNNFKKNIQEFKEVKSGTCIIQTKENATAEKIFREDEILDLNNKFAHFLQISRSIKSDNNNEIRFIKMHALLEIQGKIFVIQMVYIKPGERNFYEHENEFVFFIHPIYIKQIIVNDNKTMAYKSFTKYFNQNYEIEKSYAQQEQNACNILRLSYDVFRPYIMSLFTAQHSIFIEDLEREHPELF